MQYKFTHLSGGNAHQVDIVEALPILLGRDDVCHVRIDKEKDLGVSSQHAQVDLADDGSGYKLANLSRNGTFVNGTLVETAATLPNHATIELGRDGPRLRFELEDSAGISFGEAKLKTSRLKKRAPGERPPDTEERPAYKPPAVEDVEPSSSPLRAILLGVAIAAVIIGILYFCIVTD